MPQLKRNATYDKKNAHLWKPELNWPNQKKWPSHNKNFLPFGAGQRVVCSPPPPPISSNHSIQSLGAYHFTTLLLNTNTILEGPRLTTNAEKQKKQKKSVVDEKRAIKKLKIIGTINQEILIIIGYKMLNDVLYVY